MVKVESHLLMGFDRGGGSVLSSVFRVPLPLPPLKYDLLYLLLVP
jgi:hypothetical protein